MAKIINDLVPRNVIERIIKSPRTKEQMLLVLNSIPPQEPTTKNDLEIVMDAMEYRTNALIENIKTEIMHFANMHCSGDDVNIYDVFKVIDDCCEVDNPTTKNDLAHNLCDSCTNIGCEFQSGIVRTKCAFYMPPHIEPDNCGNYVVQEPTTKNDLGVDAISRDEVCRYVAEFVNHEFSTREEEELIDNIITGIEHMPSVTPQEPFINKPCVSSGVCEHDKNKVLDKIKAEILDNAFSVVNPKNTYEYINVLDLDSIEKILDKYKAESEDV